MGTNFEHLINKSIKNKHNSEKKYETHSILFYLLMTLELNESWLGIDHGLCNLLNLRF